MLKQLYNDDKDTTFHQINTLRYDSHIKALHDIYKTDPTKTTPCKPNLNHTPSKYKDDLRVSLKNRIQSGKHNQNLKRYKEIQTENERIKNKQKTISRSSSQSSSISKIQNKNDTQYHFDLQSESIANRKKKMYEKIAGENKRMAARLTEQKSILSLQSMENQFQKNRNIHGNLNRYKKNNEGKTVMNNYQVYNNGRYRTPSNGMNYSNKSTPRSSANNSRKSLRSVKSQKVFSEKSNKESKPTHNTLKCGRSSVRSNQLKDNLLQINKENKSIHKTSMSGRSSERSKQLKENLLGINKENKTANKILMSGRSSEKTKQLKDNLLNISKENYFIRKKDEATKKLFEAQKVSRQQNQSQDRKNIVMPNIIGRAQETTTPRSYLQPTNLTRLRNRTNSLDRDIKLQHLGRSAEPSISKLNPLLSKVNASKGKNSQNDGKYLANNFIQVHISSIINERKNVRSQSKQRKHINLSKTLLPTKNIVIECEKANNMQLEVCGKQPKTQAMDKIKETTRQYLRNKYLK